MRPIIRLYLNTHRFLTAGFEIKTRPVQEGLFGILLASSGRNLWKSHWLTRLECLPQSSTLSQTSFAHQFFPGNSHCQKRDAGR